MDNYLTAENLLNEFTTFAAAKGVAPNAREIGISKELISNQIKAYIIRNILGDNGFYPILYKNDEAVKKALESLKK